MLRKKIIAGCIILCIILGTILASGVFAVEGTPDEPAVQTDEVIPEEDVVSMENTTETYLPDPALYAMQNTSAFGIEIEENAYYFNSLTEAFDFMITYDHEISNKTIFVLCDIIFDKDYTLPTVSEPIQIAAFDGPHDVDMNGSTLYDETGTAIDLSRIDGLNVSDSGNIPEAEQIDDFESFDAEVREAIPSSEESPSADYTVVPDESEQITYRYLDIHGTVISEQKVSDVSELEEPEVPSVPGMDCLGWGDPVESGNGYTIEALYYKLG